MIPNTPAVPKPRISPSETTELGKLLIRFLANERVDLIETLRLARLLSRKGLGLAHERVFWDFFAFYVDCIVRYRELPHGINAPVEALRLSAFAVMEFYNVFLLRSSNHSPNALAACAFFGVVSPIVEALEQLSNELSLDGKHIQDLKTSELWRARRNFTHIHTRQKATSTDLSSRFRFHDFSMPGLHVSGFQYRSRDAEGSGFSVRSFRYSDGLQQLSFSAGLILQEARIRLDLPT